MIDFSRIYAKYELSEKKIAHMKEVAKISIAIAGMLKIHVNKDLLYTAAMLHDIGFEKYELNLGIYKTVNDFDFMFGHQIKTKDRLIAEGLPEVAEIASRHNAIGVTAKESKIMGSNKGVNLLPRAIESRIISFADSFRANFITKNDYWTIKSGYATEVLGKYDLIKKAESRKKRIGRFLIKNGLDYEKLYEEFINQ